MRTFSISISAFLWASAAFMATGAAADPLTPANVMTEIVFESTKTYADPFNQVELDVVFIDPSGSRLRVPAFWAGGSSWRVRYASPVRGTHRYETHCSDAANTGLDRQKGAVEVVEYRGDNRLYRHGPLRVAGDRRHLEHVDGTPFLWLGDTWWMGLCKRLHFPEEFDTLTRDRVKKGFNVVQIVAGLYPDMPAFDPRGENEAGFPWTNDYRSIRPEYFNAADRRIQHLVDNGLTPCIVGAWGYHLPWLGVERMKKHWRNLVARYGALPVVWCVAGEVTMPYYLTKTRDKDIAFQKQGWTQVAAELRRIDPFHRLVTAHPPDTARHVFSDVSVLDFDMLQTGHGDRGSIPSTIRLVRGSRAAWPIMPVINGEVTYEGILNTCFEDVQRFMVWSCFLSGTCGHTYGANGIWQVNRSEQAYGASPHGGNWGTRPWDDAMRLPGSQQVGFAKRLLEKYPWWKFEPHPEWASWTHSAAVRLAAAQSPPEKAARKTAAYHRFEVPYAAGIGNQVRVVYVPGPEAIALHDLDPAATYRARRFDPRTGEMTELGVLHADSHGDAACDPSAGKLVVGGTADRDASSQRRGAKPSPRPSPARLSSPKSGGRGGKSEPASATVSDWVVVVETIGARPESVGKSDAVRLHPDNPRYFLFRNRPLALIAATEHYGSVINRAFDFERYLADAADKHQTMTRTFLLFREQQSARNPSSPCKPESPDFVTPWPRTGPGNAIDGEPRYDLDQWNPEYFRRLHRFLSRASELGVVVELTLFSNTYGDSVWALNPLRAENNLQGIGKIPWYEYNTLHNGPLVDRQLAYAAKIIQETSPYDNVYYEICNEPGGDADPRATAADIDAWQERIAKVVRGQLARLGRKHLVIGSQAFRYRPAFRQELDASFQGKLFDAVTVHPLPGMVLAGREYMLGHFMSKELALKDFRDFCRASEAFAKPCIPDEDNAASMYRDRVGWTIHRKRAWTALLSQCHYDYIDFSITVGSEAGTRESNRQIRTWMKYLSDFVSTTDLVHARSAPDWIVEKPSHIVESALAVPGGSYIAYLADDREVTDPTCGDPISGTVSVRLPAGRYRVSFYSPTSGQFSPAISVKATEKPVPLTLAPFEHDLALRVVRED